MTTEEQRARICSICGGDRFFILKRRLSQTIELVCAKCGVKTEGTLSDGYGDTLVEAP